MNQWWLPLGVVLSKGKGWAGDRFVDAHSRGNALHKGGFAGTESALEQQQ